MFIFYYAVLSEVSPPTALSPFAAAAITGGNPVPTMMLTWKYTLPAFLVPFVFTLSPEGMGVLLQAPLRDMLIGLPDGGGRHRALAAGFGGWIRPPASLPERWRGRRRALLFYACAGSRIWPVSALTAVVLDLALQGQRPVTPATERPLSRLDSNSLQDALQG